MSSGSRSSERSAHKRKTLLVLAVVLLLLFGVFRGCLWGLSPLTHGYLSWEAIVAGFRPIEVEYGVLLGFYGEAPRALEVLVPVPTLDGEIIDGFEEAAANHPTPVSLVHNERGVFLRITEVPAEGRTLVDWSVTAKLRTRSKARVRSDLDLSSQGGRNMVWVFVKSDRPVQGFLLVTAARVDWSPMKQISLDILLEPTEGEWLLIEEEITR